MCLIELAYKEAQWEGEGGLSAGRRSRHADGVLVVAKEAGVGLDNGCNFLAFAEIQGLEN